MIRRPPRSTLDRSSAASDVYKRQPLPERGADHCGAHEARRTVRPVMKRPPIDIDGNPLAPPRADSDVADLIYLLEYARRNDYRVGPMIQIGRTIVQVRDLRQDESGAKENVAVTAW